jgi:hypothetical protein
LFLFLGDGSIQADSSFGRQGDTAKFTLPLNATTTQNLKLKYRNTETRNKTTGSLQVYSSDFFCLKLIFPEQPSYQARFQMR